MAKVINVTLVLLSSLPGVADVRFSLNGTIYQNNSVVTLEDIGEGEYALLCITDLRNCCQPPYTGVMGPLVLGDWSFPNGTLVPNGTRVPSSDRWVIYRDRHQSVVRLNRRRGGVEGIYRCDIPDTLNVTQTMYIGVYRASTGEPPLTSNRYK